MQEKKIATEVVVASCGPAQSMETLRTALAMGADRGVHVECSDPLEPIHVSKILAELAKKQEADLVIVGKQGLKQIELLQFRQFCKSFMFAI